MNRRTLLAGLGCGIAGLSGCTSSLPGRNSSEYESCNDQIIEFRRLPEEVKEEVRTAFDEGEYQTSGQLLYAQVEGSDVEALQRDKQYYESEITERQIRKSTLSFEETTVTRGSVALLKLLNDTEETWEGTVTATDPDGNRIVDEEVTLESYPLDSMPEDHDQGDLEQRITEVPLTDEYGEYEITVRPEGGESYRTTIQIDELLQSQANILIQEGGIESGVDWTGTDGEPSQRCSWDGKKLNDGY